MLLERLRNEITRLTAVKAFASIAQSPLSLDLSPVLEPLLAELTGFLRKANRVLRQAALSALEVPSFHSTGCLLAMSLVSATCLVHRLTLVDCGQHPVLLNHTEPLTSKLV